MNAPDYSQWLDSVWGWPQDSTGAISYFAAASGVVWGTNPPYTALDFGMLYPKFLGAPTSITTASDGATAVLLGLAGDFTKVAPGQLIAGPGIPPGTAVLGIAASSMTITADTTAGVAVLTGVSSVEGLYIGQPIAGPGLPDATTITSVGITTLGLSAPAAATASATAQVVSSVAITLSAVTTAALAAADAVYTAPLIPLLILNVYIRLASASLVYARWQDSWFVGMGLYVAHFVTLWAQSESGMAAAFNPAGAGLARGIETSKSADGLSVSYQNLTGFDDWGAWALTRYGQLLIDMFKAQGAGMLLLW